MKRSLKLVTAAAAFAVGLGAGSANAALVLGSNTDSSVWAAAGLSTAGYSYLGQSTSAFSGSGTGTLNLRLAAFGNSFGYSTTAHTSLTQVFGPSAPIGSSASVAGFIPSYLFYFNSDAGSPTFDNNTQFTDGTFTGGLLAFEGDIDIFKNASTNTWAFFFDDGGPGGIPDDNDYNDLVVTFSQVVAVPEPTSLLLLGAGLLGLGYMRRRKTS